MRKNKRDYMKLWVLLLIASMFFTLGCEPTTFTVVLLPDTQYYSLRYPDTYITQTKWVVDHRRDLNITAVIHLGDITHTNSQLEWENASTAHAILDNAGIPFCMLPGNHDFEGKSKARKRRTSYYNHYFGPHKFEGKTWYGGHFGTTNDNNFICFEFLDLKLLVVSLEHAPTKDVLCWAGDLIDQHPDHRVIVATHCYQTSGGEYRSNCALSENIVGSGGKNIWNELISRHANIFMVVSGHINGSEHRVRTGLCDNEVHEILTNYQNERPRGDPELKRGGNGWLRTLQFVPDENRVYVKSISVEEGNDAFFEGEPLFFETEYDSDPEHPDHMYSFSYDMTSSVPIGTINSMNGVFIDRTVNSDKRRQQYEPAVAMDGEGNFVVVWEDDSRGEENVFQIYARGFKTDGCECFKDFAVNSSSTRQQLEPDVAMNAGGDFVVVWEDDSRGPEGVYQIYARGFFSDGTERFHDKTVNSVSSGQQLGPAVAMDGEGNFVVVWEDDNDGNDLYQIYARGFFSDGTERFHDLTVNSIATGQQRKPDIAMDNEGNFVVVWEDDKNENDIFQIYARGFFADGTERFHDKTVNSIAAGQQRRPAVAMDTEGNFVVVWEDDNNNNDLCQIYARAFFADGTERFHDKTVNSIATGQQRKPDIAMDIEGNFVVVWEDDGNENDIFQIYARGFSADGGELFYDKTVNSNSSGQQKKPRIAMGPAGNFVVVWEDDLDKNQTYQILARGFGTNGLTDQ